MPKLQGASAERLADHFISYLSEKYSRNRHVRRIASWVGLIVLGVAQSADPDWRVPRDRQLGFRYCGRSFKARFNHKAGTRGGIELVEVLAGRGSPEGQVVVCITGLTEAEDFYNSARIVLRDFVRKNPA